MGRDLLLRRRIVECLDASPLIMDGATPTGEVGRCLFAVDRTHILDGFIVTMPDAMPASAPALHSREHGPAWR